MIAGIIVMGVADYFAVRRWLEHQANYRLADLAINGRYLAYLYVVLLEISILYLYLQRPNLNRRPSGFA